MSRVLFIVLLLSIANEVRGLKLEQVLILSRHHIRSPLSLNLKDFTPKHGPTWNTSSGGELTSKGYELEGYLAEYIANWLAKESLIEGCPDKKDILIRPNVKQRTIATALSFVQSAFPEHCDIEIQIQPEDLTTHGFDPIFYPTYHKRSLRFKKNIIKEMTAILKREDLTEMYMELNKILDIKNSEACKRDGICDLIKEDNRIVLDDGEEPNVVGSLRIALIAVDSFTMAYYEGFPIEDVAWGQINNEDQWNILSKAFKINQKTKFSVPSGSKDLAAPLLQYMHEILTNGTKFALLVGHDSNLNPVIHALRFKYEELPDTNEPYPIGGKLVFQKWTDEDKRSFLKVDYVYQSKDQLRFGHKLSSESPPRIVPMILSDCMSEGYPVELCPWDHFMALLSL